MFGKTIVRSKEGAMEYHDSGAEIAGVVSIRDLGSRPSELVFRTKVHVLPIEFDDVSHPHKGYQMATEADAREIVAFLRKVQASDSFRDGGDILIHCEAGVSRSTACALASWFLVGRRLTATGIAADVHADRGCAHPNERLCVLLDDAANAGGAIVRAGEILRARP